MAQHLHADADQQSLLAPHRLASTGPDRVEKVSQYSVQKAQRQHDQREHDVVGQHRDEQHHAHRYVDNEHEKLVREVLRDSVDRRDPIGHITDQTVFEKLHRQAQQPG